MKLKKLIALGLSIVMLFSLAACGAKEDESNKNEDVPSTTTPVVNENPTENNEQTDESNEEKIAYYEKYAESEDFGFAGNSIKIDAGIMKIDMLTGKDKTLLFNTIAGESQLILYQDAEGQKYVYVKMVDDDGDSQEGWFNYVNQDGEEDGVTEMTGSATEGYSIEKDAITKIEYDSTVDGIDYVNALVKNDEYVEGETVTEYEIYFNHNGKEYKLVITESTTEYGSGLAVTDEPEDFDVFEYDFDFENQKMTNKDDESVIDFEIIMEKDLSQKEFHEVKLAIDAQTKKIIEMSQVQDGMVVTSEFLELDTCSDQVQIGEITGDCDAMAFMMYYLGVMFSALPEA